MKPPGHTPRKKPSAYEAAGVSIDKGNALVERIKPLAKATKRSGCASAIGGFGALFDVKKAGFKDPVLVATTDGVGTKLKLAIESNRHDTIGIDLVAMCVNDLIVQGAEPLFFLDYYATGSLSVEQGAAIIGGIAEGCKQAGCALIGGETAEMPGMYHGGDYDLAGFAVGAAERKRILPQAMKAGDVVLGLASSGVHSNGYSLVRHILKKQGLTVDSPSPFSKGKLIDALLIPTRIYVKSCLAAIRHKIGANYSVKGLAHITGGGLLENIPRVLPDKLAVELDGSAWRWPAVFTWMMEAGEVDRKEMLRTFNCGIGMVLIVRKEAADKVSAILTKQGEKVFTIGRLTKRSGEAVILT